MVVSAHCFRIRIQLFTNVQRSHGSPWLTRKIDSFFFLLTQPFPAKTKWIVVNINRLTSLEMKICEFVFGSIPFSFAFVIFPQSKTWGSVPRLLEKPLMLAINPPMPRVFFGRRCKRRRHPEAWGGLRFVGEPTRAPWHLKGSVPMDTAIV